MQHPKGRFAQRLGNRQLVHLFVIALLQIDNLALAGAADQNHRKAIGGGIGQRRQAIQKARGRHSKANTRLLRQKARRRRGIARMLLVAERNHPHTLRLRHARQIGDRDARQAKDGVNAIELERINNQMETVDVRAGIGKGVVLWGVVGSHGCTP